MSGGPRIIVLGTSGLATAGAIAQSLTEAEIHGLAGRIDGVEQFFEDVGRHVRDCFEAGHAVIGVCASGILIRALAPALQDKHDEPPVIAVAADGSSVVPLLGGHHGGNELARRIASALSAHAAITTASDVHLAHALDDPPAGWMLANPEDAKTVMADLLAGVPAVVDAELAWLDDARISRSDGPTRVRLTSTINRRSPGERELVYHPRKIVVGVGSDRGCPDADLIALVNQALQRADLAPAAVGCVVSIDRKADESAVHAVARHFGVPARFLSAEEINAIAERIPNPSEIVAREVGVSGVAEGAALAASGARHLLIEKIKSQRATCAVAIADKPVVAETTGRGRGRLAIVGIGPGMPAWRSAEALHHLTKATDWVGYGLYLDLVADLLQQQQVHRFDLGDEEKRVRHALELAGQGRDVALVCSGDAGIYAMASLVFELLALEADESGLADGARRADIVVVPGVSAVQAAAARAGAPIGHDFCCISLSDLLTPWSVIEQRVAAAATGDFVVAFYNPRSMRRRDQLVRAMDILREHRMAQTPVIVATNLGRKGEAVTTTTLARFNADSVDMMSLVIVGANSTQAFAAGDGRTWTFTPRGYAAKREAAE